MVMIDRVALLGATDPVHARKVQRGQSVGERFGEYIRGTQPPQFDYRLTSKEDLNVLTIGFFLGTGDWGGLKKEDGTAYQPDYVRGLRNMLNTYLAARWKGPLGTIPSPLLLNKNKQFTKGPLNLTSAMKDIVKTARAGKLFVFDSNFIILLVPYDKQMTQKPCRPSGTKKRLRDKAKQSGYSFTGRRARHQQVLRPAQSSSPPLACL